MVKSQVRRKRGNIKLPKAIVGHRKVKAGFPKGQVSKDIVARAVWNNFGTSTAPERPFMTNAYRDNEKKYQAAMRKSASSILLGEQSVGDVMSRLGVMMQGDFQAEIVNLTTPGNAASTIKMKGSSNPLIDTGEMLQATTYITYA